MSAIHVVAHAGSTQASNGLAAFPQYGTMHREILILLEKNLTRWRSP